MKKAIFTIGLFSMVLVLTSFTTPDTIKNGKNDITIKINLAALEPGGNGQQVPMQSPRLDYYNEPGGNGQQVPMQRGL